MTIVRAYKNKCLYIGYHPVNIERKPTQIQRLWIALAAGFPFIVAVILHR